MKHTTTAPTLYALHGRVLKPTLGLIACALVGAMAFQSGALGSLAALSDPDTLSSIIDTVGPLAVILLLALAVVISPIPSGPVAMAAGALYGPIEGGALTAIGALLGAMIAFSLSRWLGYRPLSASNIPLAHWITRPRTQVKLGLAVFISRLIPFISFDAISYVAGLTSIKMRNFAIATTLGILPASFAFAALGAGMATLDNTALMIAACGITLILPAGWFVIAQIRKTRQVSGSNT